jgi:hypothetical protein
VLYLLTLLAMGLSGYIHLNYVAHGTANARFEDLLDAWPIFFLLLAIPLHLIATLASAFSPRRAAMIALAAMVPAWCYHVLVLCLLLGVALGLTCVSPFMVSAVFVFLTTLYSRRILKTEWSEANEH